MNRLLEKITSYSYVFIFGCGNVGQHIYEQLKKDNVCTEVRFCDNSKKGALYLGAEILAPEDAYRRHPDALFIIGSGIHHLPMLTQLRELGVTDDNIVAEWIETKSRMIPRAHINTVIYHLVEHCNLRCAGCLYFSNVAEERFADLSDFQETITRFIKIMGDAYRGGIMFLGGEPLLHPQNELFIKAARKLSPTGGISILTNGIKLIKMPESFWETCGKCAVHISISGYPLNLDITGIQKLAGEHGVQIGMSNRGNNAWLQYVLDLEGKQDISGSFVNCEQANECFLIKGRFLYNCSVTACIEHFNRKFEQNLVIQEDDYLDLYSDISAKDVLKFISTPTPFCRYCNRKKIKLGQAWRPSERVISEYLE
jgi:hypothetical protein